MPTAWAGGPHVCIPGLGTGRIVFENPRVIEIDLPAPECAVFVVNDQAAATRAVVRVAYESTVATSPAVRPACPRCPWRSFRSVAAGTYGWRASLAADLARHTCTNPDLDVPR